MTAIVALVGAAKYLRGFNEHFSISSLYCLQHNAQRCSRGGSSLVAVARTHSSTGRIYLAFGLVSSGTICVLLALNKMSSHLRMVKVVADAIAPPQKYYAKSLSVKHVREHVLRIDLLRNI